MPLPAREEAKDLHTGWTRSQSGAGHCLCDVAGRVVLGSLGKSSLTRADDPSGEPIGQERDKLMTTDKKIRSPNTNCEAYFKYNLNMNSSSLKKNQRWGLPWHLVVKASPSKAGNAG